MQVNMSLFEDYEIRRIYDEEAEIWWFSVIDIVRVLTQQVDYQAMSLNRDREAWQQHGRSEKWIQQRMTGQETRNKLTDYWSNHDVKQGVEYAILTNIIHQEWADIDIKAHKKRVRSWNLKRVKK